MNKARKEQTEREFNRLRSEIKAWHKIRVDADKLQQYKTQLNTLKNLLDNAIARLITKLNELDISIKVGEFYEGCRLFDLRVIWIRKVWNFYREKFDQRDDELLTPILKAADEIVWSCYQQAFQGDLFATPPKPKPSPLPFVESGYSPQSFPSESEFVPQNLKLGNDGFLSDLLEKLPIPLVSLPQSCVTSPWSLVYIGHEVGHQVQYALLDNKELVFSFQEKIQGIIDELPEKENEDGKTWGYWGKEIFADIYSVLMMGQWAVWAMVDFEMQNQTAMLKRRRLYPSPVVRLSLLRTVANKLALGGDSALRGLNLEEIANGNEVTKRDLSFVPAVVDELLTTNVDENLGKFRKIAGFLNSDFSTHDGFVTHWKNQLAQKNLDISVDGDLRKPRLAAMATVAAWSKTLDASKTDRQKAQKNIAKNSVRLISKSREEGAREASSEVPAGEEDIGFKLSELLMNMNKEELEN